jgi:uncharacterized protein YmfQ (DUF2313 family)
VGLDAGAYLRQLTALLPRGDGLSREPTSNLYKLLQALADELGRFDDRMEQLKREWDPSLTLEMLPDWERVLGLPDPCITEDQTVDQRRDAVVAKLTLLGGQSRAFFISLAASLGYTITITEFDPFVSGGGHSGDPLYDYEWAHTWQVNSAEDTVVYFDCNSVCSEALASWSNEALECAITDRAPAHTVVNFAYGTQYSYLQEGFGSNFTTDFHYFRPVAGDPTVDEFETVWAFSRSGPGMFRGADGVYGFADENLYSDSQNVSGTGWFTNGAPTVTLNARMAPDGTLTGDLIETSGSGHGVYHGAPTLAVGHPYTLWCIVKNDLDADNLRLGSDNTPATGWIDFNAVTRTIFAVGASIIDSGVVDLGGGWDLVWGDLFSTATGMNCIIYSHDASLQRWAVAGIGLRAGYGPVTAHLPNTSASARYKARWNHNVLDSVRRYLCEPSGTYRALWCRDLTNAAWTKSNMTPAKTATGIDGRANSATRLTATAGNATVLQAMVNGSQSRRFNPFVRRITGSGNIDITLDGGATWTTKAITGAWTRVAIGQTLADPSVGFRIVTNGDVIEVDACNCQDGDYDLSPVFTTTNSVARGGDVASRTFGAEYSTAKGTVVAKILPYTAAYGASQGTILARDTNARHLELDNTPATVGIRDGTNNIITATISAGALHKVASSFGAVVGSRVTKDGDAPSTGAYDGSWGAGTVVQLGHIGGGQQLGGEIEWLIYTPDENINTWLKGHTV